MSSTEVRKVNRKLSECTSERNRRMWKNPAYRKRMTEMLAKKNKERWADPVKHAQMATAVSNNCKLGELWKTEEFKNKHLVGCRTIESRRGVSKQLKRMWKKDVYRRAFLAVDRHGRMSEEHRKKTSIRMKKFWKDPKYIKIFSENLHSNRSGYASNNRDLDTGRFGFSVPQVMLLNKLRRLGVVGLVFECPVERYSLDIAHIPTKTDIEVDGYSFHSTSEQLERDSVRDKKIKKLGWNVLRVHVRKGCVSDVDLRKILRCVHGD